MRRVVVTLVVVLTTVLPASAQNFAPTPPARSAPGGPPATICSTDHGWCPLQAVVPPGGACYCFVPPSTWLSGSARYWPYEGRVSPYLNPHTGPPATLR
jgi:hypothetical protein